MEEGRRREKYKWVSESLKMWRRKRGGGQKEVSMCPVPDKASD